MTKLLLWSTLVLFTGSPIVSLLLVLVIGFVFDRFTMRLLPDPIAAWGRHQRAARLRATLATNPHDRQSRRELANLLVQRRRYAEAAALLEQNLQAGDDDATTALLAGVAFLGSGRASEGEHLLEAARERASGFQRDSVDLELGRFRLRRGDAASAVTALDTYCRERPGSIEGRYLLGLAHAACNEPEKARRARRAAWAEYVSAPAFQRRRERLWAYRANPVRPLAYAAVALVIFALIARSGASWATPTIPAAVDEFDSD